MNPEKIIQRDDRRLRAVSTPVALAEIGGPALNDLLRRMSAALAACDDGVALAAPQIGENRRIFIVSGKIFEPPETADLVFINPRIKKLSRRQAVLEEGCLSVRQVFGQVTRAEKASVEAYDARGKKFVRHGSGLLAQIFQHEIDHLDGILFTDKAKNLQTASPQFAFFGTDEFAVKVLAELNRLGLRPALVVTTPDTRRGRGQKLTPPPVKLWALEHNIPVFDSTYNLKPPPRRRAGNTYNLFLVASYGKILPPEILRLPKHGVLNIHPSLLPKYRGPSPIQSAILNGDPETGVSIMLVDEQMDHGPLLASKNYNLKPLPRRQAGKTSQLVARDDLATLGAELFAEILPDWLAGKIKPIPQNHAAATFTRKFTKADAEIKLTDPAELNYRKVLALNPNPGTWLTMENGARLKIKSARLADDGRFEPLRVVPEGGKEIDYRDFHHRAEI